MEENTNASTYLALLDAYKEQLETMELQSNYIQALITEYTKAKVTLEQLSKTSGDVDTLFPIGGGIFVPATFRDISKVLVSEGADIVIEKSLSDAIAVMERRIDELQDSLNKLQERAGEIQQRMIEISKNLQNMLKEK